MSEEPAKNLLVKRYQISDDMSRPINRLFTYLKFKMFDQGYLRCAVLF
jgi:hypothetical protein